MRRSPWVLVGLLVVIGLVGSPAAQAQSALVERDGLRLMRQLMSVQANAPFAGQAGTLADVVGQVQRSSSTNPIVAAINPATGDVLDYTIRIAPNGSRYEISLTPQSGCGTAWFGNEKNVIYTGKALGC